MSTNKSINYTVWIVRPSLLEQFRTEWRATDLLLSVKKMPNYYLRSSHLCSSVCHVFRVIHWRTDIFIHHHGTFAIQDLPKGRRIGAYQDFAPGGEQFLSWVTRQNRGNTWEERCEDLKILRCLSLRHEKHRSFLFSRLDLLNRTDPVETVRNVECML